MTSSGDWADAVTEVVGEVDAVLAAVPAHGWHRHAAYVDWSCWRTAEHVAGVLAHYAGQVVGRPRDHYVAFGFDTGRARTAAELREVVQVAGGLLAAAVRVADPDALGWHPHGMLRPAGFAAVGAAEALVHTYDIAAALGLPWIPAEDLTRLILDAVFPAAGPGPTADLLLRQTGRAAAAPTSWTYTAATRL
ncbi:MAG TPA: hypothetical protein VH573_12810 [Mycobacteriales bacterium]|jgi:hypothetical protein